MPPRPTMTKQPSAKATNNHNGKARGVKARFNKLDETLTTINDLKKAIKENDDEMRFHEAEACQTMRDMGLRTHVVHGELADLNASLVEGTNVVIDEAKLKKALGAKLWEKVTERKLSKDLLEAAIASGEVDIDKVSMCSEEKPKRPYILFKEKVRS